MKNPPEGKKSAVNIERKLAEKAAQENEHSFE